MPSFLGRGGTRKVEIPNLSGLTRVGAINSLQARGLNYSDSLFYTSDINLSDYISNQSLSPNTIVIMGTTVPFTYYSYSPPVTTTTAAPTTTTTTAAPTTTTTTAAPPPPTTTTTTTTAAPPPPTTTTTTTTTTTAAPVTCGACQNDGGTIIIPTCNGEDSYEGIYQPRAQFCTDGSKIPCSNQFVGFGSVIQYNSTSCGGSGNTTTQAPAPPTTTTTTSAPATTTTAAPSGPCPAGYWAWYGEQCTSIGAFYGFCSTGQCDMQLGGPQCLIMCVPE